MVKAGSGLAAGWRSARILRWPVAVSTCEKGRPEDADDVGLQLARMKPLLPCCQPHHHVARRRVQLSWSRNHNRKNGVGRGVRDEAKMNLGWVPTRHVSLAGHAHAPGADPIAGWLTSDQIGGLLAGATLAHVMDLYVYYLIYIYIIKEIKNSCRYTPESPSSQPQGVGVLGLRLDTRHLPDGGVPCRPS
jgi:hypothetical protein